MREAIARRTRTRSRVMAAESRVDSRVERPTLLPYRARERLRKTEHGIGVDGHRAVALLDD
jgi:hypothetical protein